MNLIENLDYIKKAILYYEDRANHAVSDNKVPVANPMGVFLSAHQTKNIAGAFSTWFKAWGGVIGAAHSVEAWPNGLGWRPGMDRSEWPEWTKKYTDHEIILRPGGLDAVLFGCTVPDEAPQQMVVGQRLRIRGFPAGTTVADHYEVRNGFAYLDRPKEMLRGAAPSWIVQFVAGSTLAVGGMSGGPVTAIMPDGSEVFVALLVTQNGRADLDGDGVGDQSSDVTEAYDIWMAVKAMS